MIATILETLLAAFVVIGFISTFFCACACRLSGLISQEEGHIE